MKRFALLVFFLINSCFLFAQTSVSVQQSTLSGKITGVIIDSTTQKPVDYATVSLSKYAETKSTSGTFADAKGFFKLANIKPGKYRITVSFIGYNPKVIEPVLTTDSKLDLDLGTILLTNSSKVLNEVVVQGQALLIENKIDRLVYNAEKDVAIAGGNATDVLRKVPLLSVDFDGNVSLRGNSNITVLINGKPSGAMAGNMADALKAIPADQIKNVEVITSPSAKYDAEGSSGLINIITKKNNLEGISGSVNGGLGLRQNSGNFNLNAKKGPLAITANLGGFYGWPVTSKLFFNRSNNLQDTLFNQNGESTTQRIATNGNLGVDYDFDKYNSINSSLKLNLFRFTIDGFNINQNIFPTYMVDFKRNTDDKNRVFGYDWNNSFTHKFKTEGQEISVAGQLTNSSLRNNYTSGFNFNSVFEPDTAELGNSNAQNHEKTLQVDYVQPFKGLMFETGAKTIFREINNNSTVNSFYPSSNQTNILTGRNFIYNYTQDVYAAYTSLGFSIAKKYNFKLGARYEETHIQGTPQGLTAAPNFANKYQNFVPSVVASAKISNYQTIKLSYNKRLQRPSLKFLNPFRNSADPINQSEGNPELSPELTDNLELNYSTFIKSTVINASVYYRHTSNVIEGVVRNQTINQGLPNQRNISLTTYQNVGSNNSVGFNFFGSINPIKPLTIKTNFNIYTYNINVDAFTANAATATNQVFVMYNAFFNGTYTLPKGYIFDTFFVLNAPRRTFQGSNPSFNVWNSTLKKEIFHKKGSIGINVIDPFNNRKNFRSQINNSLFSQSTNLSVPFRSVGVSFSWKFGKLKSQENKRENPKDFKNDDLKPDENVGQQGGKN